MESVSDSCYAMPNRVRQQKKKKERKAKTSKRVEKILEVDL